MNYPIVDLWKFWRGFVDSQERQNP